jgi:hypothetical protein
MKFENEKDVKGGNSAGKKPYSKPQLQVYGDLGTITKTHDAGHPIADGGVAPALTKT